MNRTFLRWKALVALVLGSTLLAACGSSTQSDAGTGSGPKAPSSVSIATVGSALTIFSPLYAAQPEFDKVAQDFNTKITMQSFGKGADALTALLGGSVQVSAGASTDSMIKAAAHGQKLVATANIFTGGGFVLVGAKKFEATTGTDIAKFTDATWGYTSEGSTSQIYTAAIVEHAGLTWADEKHVALGSIAAFVPALQSGRADVVAMDPTSAAKAVADGVGYKLFNTNDATLFVPIGGEILGNSLTFTDTFRTQYPELVQALTNAYLKSLLKLRTITDASAAYNLMPPDFQKAHPNDAVLAIDWSFSQPAWAATDGSFTARGIADTVKSAGLTPEQAQSPEVKALFDNSYIDTAYKQLGVARPSI
jgi:NitT/TauT family transport system substrate-binding protein